MNLHLNKNYTRILETLLVILIIVGFYSLNGCKPKNPVESDKLLKSGIEKFNKKEYAQAMEDFNTAIEHILYY